MIDTIIELPKQDIIEAESEANAVSYSETMFDAGVLLLGAVGVVICVVAILWQIGWLDPLVVKHWVSLGG
jgi:hypothetical protein